MLSVIMPTGTGMLRAGAGRSTRGRYGGRSMAIPTVAHGGPSYTGQRSDSKVYRMGVWEYYYETKWRNTLYYRCKHSREKPPCPARAKADKLTPEDLEPANTRKHIHQPEDVLHEAHLRHREELINLCLRQKSTSMKHIISSYINNLEDQVLAGYLDPVSIKAAVSRLRNLNVPPVPITLREAALSLEQPEFAYLGRNFDDTSDFYQGMVVGEAGEESLLFVDTELMKFVKSSYVLASDATFYCCPRILGAQQVLMVVFHAYGQVFTFAYAVMTKKTTSAYKAVFLKLKELGLQAKLVCTDWEKAERKGWKLAFPRIEMWGCLFHYQRALFKNAGKKGLARYLKRGSAHKELSRLLKLMLVLPRLPANEIRAGFEAIKREAADHLDTDKFKKMKKMFKYFERYWLGEIPASSLSVCKRNVTVTSGLESINARVNDLMPMKHPHFWLFLDLIRDYAKETYERYDRVRYGKGVKQFSKYYKAPDQRLTDDDIERHLKLFQKNRDHIDFLTAIQPTLRNIVSVLHETEDDISENVPTEAEVLEMQEEENTQRTTRTRATPRLPSAPAPASRRQLRGRNNIIHSSSEGSEIDAPTTPASIYQSPGHLDVELSPSVNNLLNVTPTPSISSWTCTPNNRDEDWLQHETTPSSSGPHAPIEETACCTNGLVSLVNKSASRDSPCDSNEVWFSPPLYEDFSGECDNATPGLSVSTHHGNALGITALDAALSLSADPPSVHSDLSPVHVHLQQERNSPPLNISTFRPMGRTAFKKEKRRLNKQLARQRTEAIAHPAPIKDVSAADKKREKQRLKRQAARAANVRRGHQPNN